MTTLDVVLQNLYPGAEWSLSGDTYSDLKWHSTTAKPTEAELEAGRKTVAEKIAEDKADIAKAQTELLARLGITGDELKILLKLVSNNDLAG